MNFELIKRQQPEESFDAEQFPVATEEARSLGDPGFFDGTGEALVDIVPNATLTTASAGLGLFDGIIGEENIEAQIRDAAVQAQEMGIDIGNVDTFAKRQSESFESVARSFRDRAKEEFTPDEASSGYAAQLIFGVGTELTKALMAAPFGSAAPAVYAANAGTQTYQSLRDEGVDKETALDAAFTSGLFSAVALKVPMAIGKTRAQSAVAGAFANEAMFLSENSVIQFILDNADYGEQAQRFDPTDPVGNAVNILTGAGFGAMGIKSAPKRQSKVLEKIEEQITKAGKKPIDLTHAIVDAARTRYLSKRVYEDQIAPKDSARLTSKSKRLEQNARESLDRGERVDITEPIADAGRVEAEQKRLVDSMHQVMQQYEGDPLELFMTLGDDPKITVRRGMISSDGRRNRKGVNEIAELGTDFGLVKVAIKHVKEEDPKYRITDDDLRNVPWVVREYDPATIARNGQRTWRYMDETGRELVIASKKFPKEAPVEDTLLTIYIQNPTKRKLGIPYSKKKNKAANPSPELQIPEEDTAARLSSVGSRPASSAVAEQVTTQSRGIAEDTGSANPADELTTPAADTAARLPLSSRTTFSADQSERFTTQSPGTAPESNIPESDSVWGRVANAVRRVLGLEDQATNEVEVDAVEAPSRLQVQGLLKEETGVPEEELLTKELDAVIDYREDGTPVTGREFIRSETVAADEINKFADVLPDASECVYRNNGI